MRAWRPRSPNNLALCDNAALPPALLAAPLRESAGLRALVAALVRQGCLDVDLELDL